VIGSVHILRGSHAIFTEVSSCCSLMEVSAIWSKVSHLKNFSHLISN
jgi:hypothetical protein